MGQPTKNEILHTRQMAVPHDERSRMEAVATRIWGNGDLSQSKVDTLRDINRFFS